mgnify:CR=1 FL=1
MTLLRQQVAIQRLVPLVGGQSVAAAAPFMASTDPARGLDSVCTTWPSPAGFTNEPFAAMPTPTLVVGFAGDLYYPFSRTAQLAKDLSAPLLNV